MLIKARLGGRYMKQVIAFALILGLSFTTLTGCNGNEEKKADDAQ
jgi:hypothetical protein